MCYTSMAPNKIYRVIFIGELVSEISVTIEQEVKAQKKCVKLRMMEHKMAFFYPPRSSGAGLRLL